MKIFKKHKRSLNSYIILNMLIAFVLSLVAVVLGIVIGYMLMFKEFDKEYLAKHPEYADMSYFEQMDAKFSDEEYLSYEPSQASAMKMLVVLVGSVLIVSIGGTFLIFALFVSRIRRRLVRELNRFDTALGVLPQISGGNAETTPEIHSGIREFDTLCLRFNQISDRLKESEAERSKLEVQQRKMIADISHDLKTPITVIQGYSKAVRDNVADDETKEKYLDAICRKSEMVTELINTFHEYSKLDHPDFSFHMAEGDLCEYFREYLALKYHDLELAGFGLEFDLPEHPVIYAFDKQQLSRVFENLMSNSFRYNPPGTVLYSRLFETEDSIVFQLGDNGRGIPKALRSTIFDPFVVGTESRTNSRGSGLGLAICKRIIEAHQGTIALVDDPEGIRKTLYEIRFPKQQS